MRILSICYQLRWNHYTPVSLCVFAPFLKCTTNDKKVSSEPYGLMYTNKVMEGPFIFMSYRQKFATLIQLFDGRSGQYLI